MYKMIYICKNIFTHSHAYIYINSYCYSVQFPFGLFLKNKTLFSIQRPMINRFHMTCFATMLCWALWRKLSNGPWHWSCSLLSALQGAMRGGYHANMVGSCDWGTFKMDRFRSSLKQDYKRWIYIDWACFLIRISSTFNQDLPWLNSWREQYQERERESKSA